MWQEEDSSALYSVQTSLQTLQAEAKKKKKKRSLRFKEQDSTLREANQMRIWALGPPWVS